MFKDFFIPTNRNRYYPVSIRPKFLYTYLVFMVIFNLFAARFLISIPYGVSAQATIALEDIISLANQDRIQYGLQTLKENQLLDNAAQAKADDMFKYQYWAHYNPTTGASPWSFIVAAGYQYHYAGENLAEGFQTATDVNTAWMNSAEHKANILDSNFQDIGVAVEQGELLNSQTILVVQMFGTLQPNVSNIAPNSTPTPQPPKVLGVTPTKIPPKPIQIAQNISVPTPTALFPSITPTEQLPEINKPLAKPLAPTTHISPSPVQNIVTQIDGIKFTNKVNFFVAIFLFTIFILDSIYYYRVKDIHKNNRPNSIAHLPLLILLIVICIIGTTGITL